MQVAAFENAFSPILGTFAWQNYFDHDMVTKRWQFKLSALIFCPNTFGIKTPFIWRGFSILWPGEIPLPPSLIISDASRGLRKRFFSNLRHICLTKPFWAWYANQALTVWIVCAIFLPEYFWNENHLHLKGIFYSVAETYDTRELFRKWANIFGPQIHA